MTITLITQEQYDRLLQIQKDFPKLTFQNKGYEYIKKSELTEDDFKAIDEISSILKIHIKGFSKFNNFKISQVTNEVVLRFQYNWSADDDYSKNPIPFIGVGYLDLIELHKGFRENWKFNCEECGKEVSEKELKEKTIDCLKCR